MKTFWIAVFSFTFMISAWAAEADPKAGDAAWAAIVQASKTPPKAPQEMAEFKRSLADQLKAFYTKYPNHPRASDAWIKEQGLRPAPPATQMAVAAPKAKEPVAAAVPVAQPVKPVATAPAIPRVTPVAPPPIVHKKPLTLAFTSTDGRRVDLSQMTGKVVLIDFWATWCGPCRAELPNVKKAYADLHDQGFEIVGISFDNDPGALAKVVASEKMTWPQFCDNGGWQNAVGKEFGIDSIPTMYLIDKNGKLRDTNGRQDLEGKVRKLLAEK